MRATSTIAFGNTRLRGCILQDHDNWKFEAGLRWYRYQSASTNVNSGFFSAPGPVQTFEISDSGFNPRFDLSYAPNADLTAYISASRGFSRAAPLVRISEFLRRGQTPPYQPDSVWNYEIGEKAKCSTTG